MKIRAAVTRAPRAPFSIESLDLEAPRADEILVRIVAVGVCHTDMVMRDQHLPTPQPVVLGHEGAGIVEAVGAAVTKVAPGDHVVLTYSPCGQCPSCANGAMTYCHDFTPRNFMGLRADGSSPLSKGGERIHANIFGQSSFSTHAITLEANTVKVPKDVPLHLLGPLGCGIQTGAGTIINALKPSPGRSLAIFGMGAVGLSALLAAKACGMTEIIAIDILDSRVALARELGATRGIDASKDDPVAVLAPLGLQVDYSLDTTGHGAVIRQATDILAPRGTCAIVGASPLGAEVKLDLVAMMSGGRRLQGVVEGDSKPDIFIPDLIALYRAGLFPFDRLIKTYPFDQINAAFEDGESGRAIKPVLLMPGHEDLVSRPATH